MRRRAVPLFVGLLLGLLAPGGSPALAAPEASALEEPAAATTIEAYVREGCPRCAEAEAFLAGLAARRGDVVVIVRDVGRDPAAREQMRRRAEAAGVDAAGVPLLVIGARVLVGYGGDAITGRQIVALLDAQAAPAEATGGAVCELGGDPAACPEPAPPAGDAGPREADDVVLPVFGEVRAGELGLPLFTLMVGLVDGFNPCAMWVLLFLLSLLANLRDRRRMALIGATFVVISGAAYYAFMAAWLSVFRLIGLSRAVQIVLGVVALAIGALNVKDFVRPHRGPSLHIPEAAKPGIYRRARAIVQAERVGVALASAATLAVLVNIVELACTAGLPAIYTQVLAAHHLPAWGHYGYLLLYIAAYMFDDAIMVTIAVVTLSRKKLQERGGRALKLVSGLVMLFLGIALVAFPGLLEW